MFPYKIQTYATVFTIPGPLELNSRKESCTFTSITLNELKSSDRQMKM